MFGINPVSHCCYPPIFFSSKHLAILHFLVSLFCRQEFVFTDMRRLVIRVPNAILR